MLCLLLGIALLSPAAADPQAAGLAALDRQDYQQAKQIFSDLAAANARDYSAFFYLALAETSLKEDEQAGVHFRKVLELKPGLYEAELNLGILELRRKQPAEAIPLLRDAAKQRPNQARPNAISATRYWHREILPPPPRHIARRWPSTPRQQWRNWD